MIALPVCEAAKLLGVGESTLRGYLRRGAPVAKRGGRGRGRRTLIDVEAVRAWRRGSSDDALRVFAARVPEVVAGAIYDAHREIGGPQKRAVIQVLPSVWYAVTLALLDEIRKDAPGVNDPAALPEKIAKLLAILR